jgi:hypothetical protein
MIKHATLATIKNPLWKAVLLRDTNVLGELTRKEFGTPLAEERTSAFLGILQFLREQGAIRTDMSINAQVHLLSAISMGFILVEPFVPDELRLSDEEAVEVMADSLKRSFEPRTSAASPEKESEMVTQVINRYFEQTVNSIKEQEQKEI